MLENVDRIMSRMRQIERKIDGGAAIGSNDFQALMQQQMEKKDPTSNPKADLAASKLAEMGLHNRAAKLDLGIGISGSRDVVPFAQSNSVSCGQTSVAMCINSLTGQNLTDMDIDARYGFHLLDALNAESRSAGYDWKDAGDLKSTSWDLIDHKVNKEKLPVIVALNGPEFSPSGRGHIVTIVKTEGDTVTYADPANGQLKTTTKQAMNTAPSHPDGNFIFYSVKQQQQPNAGGILPFS